MTNTWFSREMLHFILKVFLLPILKLIWKLLHFLGFIDVQILHYQIFFSSTEYIPGWIPYNYTKTTETNYFLHTVKEKFSNGNCVVPKSQIQNLPLLLKVNLRYKIKKSMIKCYFLCIQQVALLQYYTFSCWHLQMCNIVYMCKCLGQNSGFFAPPENIQHEKVAKYLSLFLVYTG